MKIVDLGEWSLIPGPLENPPATSLDLHDIETYEPKDVAAAILAVPGMRRASDNGTDWWSWRATWAPESGWVEIGFSLFETEPPAWGGSKLAGACKVEDVVALVSNLRRVIPGLWLHNNDCEIHSPESFGRVAVGD